MVDVVVVCHLCRHPEHPCLFSHGDPGLCRNRRFIFLSQPTTTQTMVAWPCPESCAMRRAGIPIRTAHPSNKHRVAAPTTRGLNAADNESRGFGWQHYAVFSSQLVTPVRPENVQLLHDKQVLIQCLCLLMFVLRTSHPWLCRPRLAPSGTAFRDVRRQSCSLWAWVCNPRRTATTIREPRPVQLVSYATSTR